MRRIDVEKKRVTRAPWLLGLVVLGLALWGVTILLRPPAEPEPPEVGVTASDTLPPALIPMDPARLPGSSPERGSTPGVTLSEEHVGETVRVQGEVVATGGDTFWILVDSRALRVASPRRPRRGDRVSVSGTLREVDGATLDRGMADAMARHPDFDRWTVVRTVELVEDPAATNPTG